MRLQANPIVVRRSNHRVVTSSKNKQ
nr:hypothetical protein [Tanacetum cinerariifolium]